MEPPMTKAKLVEAIRKGRAEWDALVDEVGTERMSQPGVAGQWSVKDVIAHITWHEREMIGVAQAHALVGSNLWDLPTDQRNAAIFEANRDRSLADVLTEAQQVFPQFLAAVEGLTDEDVNDPGRFAHMPADWQPWKLIAENSYEHYEQHIPDIRAWLDAA
jgi:hypothetical protein